MAITTARLFEVTLRGGRLWGRHLVVLSKVAAVTWIPVYALLAIAAIGLNVSDDMVRVVGSIRSGQSPDALGVYLIALDAALSLLLTLIAVPLGHGVLISAVGLIELHSTVDI